MVSPSSHTPPSPGPQSPPASTISMDEQPPPPPPNSIVTTTPRFDAPNAPSPTEFAYRTRRPTITHRARSDSISSFGKRSNPPGLAEQLERIYEENPGEFFEGPSQVPENTPKTSHYAPSASSSPRSDRGNLYPTILNLPHLNEQLEVLPPPAASRFSSPPSSIAGESLVSEPLMMAVPRRFYSYSGNGSKPNPPSPLSAVKEQEPPEETHGGVREHSDWGENILQDLARGLIRLSNLAEDDEKRDPTKIRQVHYKERLNLLLNDSSQPITYGPIGDVPYPAPAAPVVSSAARRPQSSPSVHTNYVSWSEFKELKDRVNDLNRLVKQLTDMHSHSQKEINMLKSEASNLKKVLAGSGIIKATNTSMENDASKMV
ncbi:hypothetical protein BLS_009719 [Venturia inaequalis]|uniref:Uncharacterized protein n=1 Tax=Venturia inaequalis TaxID=5025 RepID=A0A8H3YJQ5_VENIN|nr:hypothetical protein BLS_009719 [Venturia inaequalis]